MTCDEDLFRAAALEILVKRYHAPLLAHISHLVADMQSAEDIVQETFVCLVRDAQAYRYPRPFLPWFYTIARRLALNYHTSAYRRHIDLGAPIPETEADEPDPAAWLERWEQHHELRRAISNLSFEQREILSLRYGQQFRVKEIATLLSIPEGTVKSRTFHALRQLRQLLEQQSPLRGSNKQGDQAYG
jgi:RNA polymerase sigma factor (sigma-70 family)